MKKGTKQFEKRIIRIRDIIEKKGLRMIHKSLIEQYYSVLPHLRNAAIDTWPEVIDTMSEIPIQVFYNKFYPMFAPIGTITRKQLLESKAAENEAFYESVFSQQLQQLINGKVGDNITSITMTSRERMKSAVRQIIADSETEGLGIEKIKEKIIGELGKFMSGNIQARARAIAQTETISASNEAAMMAAKSTHLAFKKYWSTSGLPDVRDSHIAMEQYSAEVDGLKPDEAFPNGLQQPGDMSGAAEEVINCYTGDMTIKSAIVSGQKLFYSGNMVKIVTRGGKWITITPNHYVLTKKGLIKARSINKGDYLVCNSENIKRRFRISRNRNHINNKKTILSKIFSSLIVKHVSEFTPVVGLDFDGDGKFGNGNINIVNINRILLHHGKKIGKYFRNFSFKKSDSKAFLIERFCSLDFSFSGMFRSSNSIMRFLYLVFSLFGSHLRPFKFLGVGLSSHHYSLFSKMPIERDSWNPSLIRELIKTNPGLIHLDEVVEIVNFEFSGHVYDFTSLTGTNIVNNIYTSNCRCTLLTEIT